MARRQRTAWTHRRFGVAVLTAVLIAVAGCTSTPVVGNPAPATSASPPSTVPPPDFAPPPDTAPATSSAADPAAVIYGCDSQPVTRPTDFILLCGDAGEELAHLAWSDWGRTSASATGQIVVKSCTPDCASGASIPYVATVTVTGLFGGSYTKMHISAPQAPVPAQNFAIDMEGPLPLTRLPTGY